MNVKDIVISDVKVTQKDHDRAQGLEFCHGGGHTWWHGSGAPFTSEASKMAKLIKDPLKLIRRSIAVVSIWGIKDRCGCIGDDGKWTIENVWPPFENKLREMGFSRIQIDQIVECGFKLRKTGLK